MRPYLEIPLFLLPAFLFTSEILIVNATATVDTRRVNLKKSRSPDSSDKFNLTRCAKQCRTEFFQYCHTREPDAKGDSNAFRTCMCVYKSGAQYMEHCARHCNGEDSFPEQVGEMRAWWSDWCGKHEPTSTTSISIPGPSGPSADIEKGKTPGMPLIGDSGKPGKDPLRPTPSSKPERTPESKQKGQGVSVITTGASVTFASAFLFLGYVMFLRRSKYARRRGVLAWLRLKLLERGYRGGGVALPRSRTTAMRMRVTNGRMEVVGNPKWLNKTMPPLPQPRSTSAGESRDVRNYGNDIAHTRAKSGFLSRIMGRQEQATPGGLRRGGVFGQIQGGRKSHRYSQGWLNAAKKYTDAEEEDEKVQDYFRGKGIARSGKYTGISSSPDGNDTLPEGADEGNRSPKDWSAGEGEMYGEGGLDVGEDDGDVEGVEGGSQRQSLQVVSGDEEYSEGLIGSSSRSEHQVGQFQHDINEENCGEGEDRDEWSGQGRSQINYLSTGRDSVDSSRPYSPDEDYALNAAISATPHLDSLGWDSWTGVESTQINATGGLRRIPGGSYGKGGLDFEEVDLVELEYDGTAYGWTARSDAQFSSYSGMDTNITQGSSGYGPILPVIEPDPQHGRGSTEYMQHTKMRPRSKWRVSGKVPKGFLGRKGKRSNGSGSTDLGRGAYGSV